MVTVMGKTRVDSKIRTCGLNDFSQPLLFLVSRYAILKVLIMIFVFFLTRRFPLIVPFSINQINYCGKLLSNRDR